jgi:SpoVK/Ycf46/Vps4 family AAA+-type ATPase
MATAPPRLDAARDIWSEGLLPALRRLDLLLERAVVAAQALYGPQAAADPYRGLYISHAEAERALSASPGEPLLCRDGAATDGLPDPAAPGSPLAWLRDSFALSLFDLDALLVALAPELDPRYERLYAYLQDDVSRRRPSVDLVLNLLCPSAADKLHRRIAFGPGAPLVRHGLVHVLPDPNQSYPPFLAHVLKPDEQVVRLLVGDRNLDARLAACAVLVEPPPGFDAVPVAVETMDALTALIARARDAGGPLRLYFQGPRGVGKRGTAAALAGAAGARLLDVDLGRLAGSAEADHLAALVFREARFQDAVLLLDGLDALRAEDRAGLYQRLLTALAAHPGVVILAGTQPWAPPPLPLDRGPVGVTVVGFPAPAAAQRYASWQAGLIAAGIHLPAEDVDALADRFRLTGGQIADAIATARADAARHAAERGHGADVSAEPPPPSLYELFSAARAQTGHELAALSRRVEPAHSWDDIVLPEDAIEQMREICSRLAQRRRVMDAWGFERRLSLGKGVNALFTGPSGTGKTMAAEIIGRELGLDLYRIDLAGVVSKYIGETEKNLDRVFAAAENANAVLFFDEADALFGKRSEVRDSHDRYANIEIAYLLQKMEQYDGIVILATNLRGNLDESFTRRLAFTVHFPFPDEAARRRIWAGIWPAETPLAADVDLDLLTRRFKLSGGNIKNVALAAAFLAAADGGPVHMSHLLRAVRREYQKMGKVLTLAELEGEAQEVAV